VRLLLDTHIFLWFLTADGRLPAPWLPTLRDPGNETYVSVVSLWEATVKWQLGKLPLPAAPDVYLPHQRTIHQFASLALDEGSVARLGSLPAMHRDPFDRMLICQAIHHGLTLVSMDGAIAAYANHITLLR
jgi:PIN domain nuclease of toxin-antitoxin system